MVFQSRFSGSSNAGGIRGGTIGGGDATRVGCRFLGVWKGLWGLGVK